MLQKFWVCSQLEIKGVTAYAVCTYSYRCMCSAHVGGATASQVLVVVLPYAGTPHEHSQILRKKHSGFAHVGSDGLRRLTNKSKPGITCEHVSRACFICHLRMVTSYFKLLLLSYLLPPQ